ncbi:MAG TPA: type II toxin-antitoxin system RelE/ParE family toxin [Longimicrobiaceae bacterium]|nr:type II toxin-antitoxin system RelE/ParE family toxin [Longimicrobiaceae bacterium]
MRRVRFISPALAEVADAADFYLARSQKAADGLMDAVDHATDLIRRNPEIGHLTEKGARRVTLSGYRYDLVYSLRGEEVVVNAVAHHRREPFYWVNRLD